MVQHSAGARWWLIFLLILAMVATSIAYDRYKHAEMYRKALEAVSESN